MLRLAIICADYPDLPSGIGDYTHKLVSELRAGNVEVHVITTSHDQIRADAQTLQVDWSISSLGRITRYCREHAIQFINILAQLAQARR